MTKKKTPSTAGGADDEAPPVEVAADAGVEAGPEAAGAPTSPSSAEYSVAFSPRQVAVGLAIVAGLVAIALRHRKRRDRPGD
jgi:hypothetical protein